MTVLKLKVAALVAVAGLDTAPLPGLSEGMKSTLEKLDAELNSMEVSANQASSRLASFQAAQAKIRELADAGDKDANYALARWAVMSKRERDVDEVVGLYRKAADKGHIAAKCELAQVLMQAFPQERERIAEAIKLIKEAAEAENKIARRLLAHLLITGAAEPVLASDAAMGLAMLEKANIDGDAEAALDLNQLYEASVSGIPKNEEKARAYLKDAVDQKSAAAMIVYAAQMLWRDVTSNRPMAPKDGEEAVRMLESATARGSVMAHRFLGVIYEGGLGGQPKDVEKAVTSFMKAANGGDAQAVFQVAGFLETGVKKGAEAVLPKNVSGALEMYRVAADYGWAEASHRLGDYYETGTIVEKDLVRAFNFHLSAAKAGLPEAQLRVGSYYEKGEGAVQDSVSAMGWYQRAAEADYAPGRFSLGQMYESGTNTGGKPQWRAAAMQYGYAAEQGFAPAMLSLARLYERGLITPKHQPDLPRALAYAGLAAEADTGPQTAESVKFRDRLKGLMNAEDLSYAEKIHAAKAMEIKDRAERQARLRRLRSGNPASAPLSTMGIDPNFSRAEHVFLLGVGWAAIFTRGPQFCRQPRLRLVPSPSAGPANFHGKALDLGLKPNYFEGPTVITELLHLLEEGRPSPR